MSWENVRRGPGDVPGDIGRFPFEEIWNEDLILVVLIGGGEDICSLNRLWEISEDIVDVEECLAGC
jgi:hypothetical protein